jgi:hypothetical protein
MESCTGGPCGGSTTTTTTTRPAAGTGGAGGGSDGGTEGGTGGEPDATKCPTTPQTGDFPCDVFAVVHASCNPCHQNPPKNGAPFPILTYADTQKVFIPGLLVFQQMWISTGPNGCPRMPFGGMLSDPDYATLHGWLDRCAPPLPAGTGCGCPGNGCN